MILHPCRKCLIRPCCIEDCQGYERYVNFMIGYCVSAGVITFFITMILPVILIDIYRPMLGTIAGAISTALWMICIVLYLRFHDYFYLTRNLKNPLFYTLTSPIVFHIMLYCFIGKMYVQQYRQKAVKSD